jgi:adenosylcobinamide-GDP ribazoletransferase
MPLAAIQFLTVIPVPWSTAPPGEGALFFPLTGALLGASAGVVFLALSSGMDRSMAALLAVTWLLMLTGCLHEDGLADVADAVRAGRTRQRMMEILKDSRIGAYGAVALILSIGLRWGALARSGANAAPGLVAALALSRASLVVLAGTAPSVGTGLAQSFALSCSTVVVAGTVAESLVIAGLSAFFLGWRTIVVMVVVSAVVLLLARHWFTQRLGGVNGDCLGATCQVVEIANLLVLAWQPSI